jgi:hypothetical protein
MTVPHGCKAGCEGPDTGISGIAAGAVWGTLCGLLVLVVRQGTGWRAPLAMSGAIVLLALFTIFEPN